MPSEKPNTCSAPATKQEQILHAAGDLFLDLGFENTSMIKVAEAAEVSKQTIYSHFGSKEELFTAVINCKCVEHQITPELFNADSP